MVNFMAKWRAALFAPKGYIAPASTVMKSIFETKNLIPKHNFLVSLKKVNPPKRTYYKIQK